MSIWIKRIAALLLIIAVTAITFYFFRDDYELWSVKRKVTSYNELLPEVYAAFKPELLKDCATGKEIGKIEMYLGMMKFKENRWLKSELKRMEFRTAEVKGSSASIKTYEEWVYQYYEMETAKPLGKLESIRYNGSYTLTKEGNKWLISEVVAEEIKNEERKSK